MKMVDLDGDGSFYDVDGVTENTGANGPCPALANYHQENDRLAEAGAILRGETRKLVTLEHLQAVAHLVREARVLLDHVDLLTSPTGVDLLDWLRETRKVIG